jgi:PAS domain S-box-containing protein
LVHGSDEKIVNSDHESPIHVLHVDDDRGMLDLVSEYLGVVDESLRVVSVADPERGLERLRADDDIECVLSDYEMPEMDGLTFLSCVRSARPTIPFVLYTARGDEEIASRAITAGVSDYVQKSTGTAHYRKLSVRIRNEVARARAERQKETQLAALEAARDGICVLDADGRVTYANEAYLDLYGYEREELYGTHWEALHPEEEVAFMTREVLPRVEEEGEWRGDSEGRRSDGRTFRESKSVATLPGGGLVIVATAYDRIETRS